MKEVTYEEFSNWLHGPMGLIVGPGVVHHSGYMANMAQKLAEQLCVEPAEDYLTVGDRARETNTDLGDIRRAARNCFTTSRASSYVSQLAGGKWCAVVSACIDNLLEEKMRAAVDKHPSNRSIYVANDLSSAIPPRSVPIFKLLGSMERDDFVVTTGSYLSRKGMWRRCLPEFSDCVRGNPVLCLGMGDCPSILFDLLGELLADPRTCPKRILFMADDPLTQNRHLIDLAEPQMRLSKIPGKIGELVRSASDAERSGYTLTIDFSEKPDKAFAELTEYDYLCVLVNTQLSPTCEQSQSLQLRDILFSPSLPRWDPFAFDLDFTRTLTGKLFTEINRLLNSKNVADFTVVVSGGAASGKTTLLKRLAFQLAKQSSLVVWFRSVFSPDPQRMIRGLFGSLKNYRREYPEGIICVVDDPIGLGSLSVEDIVSAAQNVGLRIVLILGVRVSDTAVSDSGRLFGTCPVLVEEQLPDTFDEEEWARLPKYLVTIGISPDLETATKICEESEAKVARDTLGMMYYLLHEARETISSSVRTEYFRLGDVAAFRSFLLGAVSTSSDVLKRAYDFVAVSDFYDTAIPVEVLVAALGVDYEEWLDAWSGTRPAAGILYPDATMAGGAAYRTRNSVVTKILVTTLNGGSFGHSGELNVLRSIIAGCQGRGAAVYREYLLRILVSSNRITTLEYEEGLELFESAIKALVYPDRTLKHQMGLWIKRKGKDPLKAIRVFEDAIRTDIYPYTDRGEAPEHIHTSCAAATVDAIDLNEISLEEGKNLVLDHLSRARSIDFFNPNAVHVQGGLVLRLIGKMNPQESADSIALVTQAIADIDRTLLVMQPSVKGPASDEALEDMMSRLFCGVADPSKIAEKADELWNGFQNQHGFVLQLRQSYYEARKTEKGKAYKKAWMLYRDIVRRVEEEGVVSAKALHEVAIDIIYAWRIARNSQGQGTEWELIESLAKRVLVGVPLERQNVLHRFILGLSLAQQKKWVESSQIFASIRSSALFRDLLWKPRCYLTDENNTPTRLQAKMQTHGDRTYAFVESLGRDFRTNTTEKWPRDGEVSFVYVRFSFGGTTATQIVNNF